MESTSSTSSTSSIITTLGAGSGINMTQLAGDLAKAQFEQRTNRLTAKGELLQQKITAASNIKNGFSTLASSLGDLVRTGNLAPLPKVANSSVATASTPIGTIGKGSYSLEVTQLAKRQVLTGPAMASATDPVGAGSLTIRFGKMDGTTFTEDTGQAAVDITIDSGSTLKDIASKINAAGAGVSAYIAQTVNGPQLVFKGAEGEQSGFVIEATETPGEEGLAALAWQPGTGSAAQLKEVSQDAKFKLDGLEMTSKTNSTGQIAPGLQLSLTGTNIGNPTAITFANTTGGVPQTMSDLVTALNEVVSELNRATAVEGGELRGDPGARALKLALSQLPGTVVMPNATGNAPRTLSDLGLVINRDGSFKIDDDRLAATLERDPDGVAAMFTTGLYGVYSTFDKLSRSASSTGDANSLASSIKRYEGQAQQVTERTAELAEKQEALRLQMVSRFAKADARVAASQSTMSFLQQQIDAWNSSN
ncbi:flagellar filament capping protein FliD [Aurantiacibacter suaedae]|uniref:flagellar filament capping protein FliD n=1 Tax=Aurantiacibacter suaedae TaxID=2545755 RepID=UPI0010F9E4AA|nr:flagellar filament capping protein FliD [Aurantiacibacter suaedae]